jgi:DNA polymerase III epsilon subunit-like protein
MNYLVIDTETTNGFDDPLVYDCGWSIVDECGNILKTRSYVVADVFYYEKELMQEAYFADKIPQYLADVANGSRKVAWFKSVRKMLYKDCKRFDVVGIVAHNASFDYRALQTTQRYLTKSKWRWFFPWGVPIWDSLRMSREVFEHDDDYINFCKQNGFCYGKNNNRVRLTAEVLYKYLTNNVDFEESHTGLEDTLIEKEIFLECLKRNPNVSKSAWGD